MQTCTHTYRNIETHIVHHTHTHVCTCVHMCAHAHTHTHKHTHTHTHTRHTHDTHTHKAHMFVAHIPIALLGCCTISLIYVHIHTHAHIHTQARLDARSSSALEDAQARLKASQARLNALKSVYKKELEKSARTMGDREGGGSRDGMRWSVLTGMGVLGTFQFFCVPFVNRLMYEGRKSLTGCSRNRARANTHTHTQAHTHTKHKAQTHAQSTHTKHAHNAHTHTKRTHAYTRSTHICSVALIFNHLLSVPPSRQSCLQAVGSQDVFSDSSMSLVCFDDVQQIPHCVCKCVCMLDVQ